MPKRLYTYSVFARQSSYSHPNARLAALFHRSAATLYTIYAIWGILAIVNRIPTLSEAIGHVPQLVFSALTVLVCIPAGIGAMYFPRTAKLELLAASSFIVLLLIYMFFLFIKALTEHSPPSWAALTLIASCLVIPIARAAFIYVTLIKQAKEN